MKLEKTKEQKLKEQKLLEAVEKIKEQDRTKGYPTASEYAELMRIVNEALKVYKEFVE